MYKKKKKYFSNLIANGLWYQWRTFGHMNTSYLWHVCIFSYHFHLNKMTISVTDSVTDFYGWVNDPKYISHLVYQHIYWYSFTSSVQVIWRRKNSAYGQHSALSYVYDSGVPKLYHKSESNHGFCQYYESMSIPWVHVYTMSPCLYHESMSIP